MNYIRIFYNNKYILKLQDINNDLFNIKACLMEL